MAKLTKTTLITGLYNGYDIARRGPKKVYLSYHHAESRACTTSKWLVVGCGFKTDLKGPWYNYGSKSFSGNMRSPALDEAKAWASAKYGITEWERDPFGDWQDKRAMDAVRELIAGRK